MQGALISSCAFLCLQVNVDERSTKNAKRNAATRAGSRLVAAVGLPLIGAVGASAWTFATTTSPQRALYDGSSFGDGVGDIDRNGLSTIRIDVKLKDPGSDGNPVYQQTNGWKTGQVRWFASLRPDICSTKTSSTLEAGAVGTLT